MTNTHSDGEKRRGKRSYVYMWNKSVWYSCTRETQRWELKINFTIEV